MARKRQEGTPTRRPSSDDLWRRVSEPGPGARVRGYLRFSNQAGHYGLTLEGQRQHIRAYAEARGWVLVGFDEEPAQTAKWEEIERRPVFQRHLAAATRGDFAVSLCYMADRWARNKITAFVSISQLRKAGVWWATTDGKWTIDRTEEDGWDVAFAVEVTLNAAYSRKVSDKTRIGKQTRAALGFHNGDVMFGYQRPADPPRPVGMPLSWRPPRQPLAPHPVNFERLQQLGQWAAAGLSDAAIAQRANDLGWRTQTEKAIGPRLRFRGAGGCAPSAAAADSSDTADVTGLSGDGQQEGTEQDTEQGHEQGQMTQDMVGARPFSKDSVRSILINPFPREFAPSGTGSGYGTIWTPAGERIAGQHCAAWSWDLWHRIDERRALRQYGSRGQQRQRDTQGAQNGLQGTQTEPRASVVWVFSGYVVCAACGSRLRADGHNVRGYLYYRDTARRRGIACVIGQRERRGMMSVRADDLDAQFTALLAQTLPVGWRERIATQVATQARETPDWQAIETRRETLARELERLKFQHRHGLLDDADLVREADRIQQALTALPSAETQAALLTASLALGETLEARRTLAAYWLDATPEQRVELVTGLLTPEGIRYDLRARRIAAIRPRLVALPVLRELLAAWPMDAEGWLVCPPVFRSSSAKRYIGRDDRRDVDRRVDPIDGEGNTQQQITG